MSPTEIRVAPGNKWRALLLAIAAVGGFYFLFGYIPTIVWLIGPIVLIALVFSAVRGQSTDPVIILDDEGVLDRRLKVGVIRWDDIRRIKSYSLSGAEYISLELHNAKTYTSRRPLWLTLLSQVQRVFGMTSIAISTNGLDTDHHTLLHLLHEGCGSQGIVPRTIEME